MSSALADRTLGLTKMVQSTSVSQVVFTLFIILLVRLIARAIWRIYFHPLSRFPGPKLAAATRIPHHIATFIGTPHKRVSNLHRQYGDVVRISPDELSCIDPQGWRDIYGHGTKGTRGSVPSKHFARYGTTFNGAPSLLVAEDADHARMRRIFNPAFSDRALKAQESLFIKYVDLLVEKLREGIEEDADRKFDMVRMYNFTTFDIMSDLTFGEPLNMLSNAEYDPWVSLIFGLVKYATRLGIIMHYPLLQKAFKAFAQKGSSKQRKQKFSFSRDRVTKRLEKGRDSEGVDLWDLVLSQPEGKGLSRDEMDSNAGLFMSAGTETTATLVSGMTFLLLKNPGVMRRLTKEIRDAFQSPDGLNIERCAALPYLNACIKETFRLYPPVVTGFPRLTPSDGSTVCGQFIPPGFVVCVPQWAMYTSERNFKHPMSFIPERWLGDERFANDEKACLQPFSVGSRDCLGKNMAYHEMRLIMTKVLHSFDFELCPESEDWTDQECYTLWQKKPLMCKIKVVR